MGTFINFESEGKIKEEKKLEYGERLKKLLNAGGMMKFDVVEMYDQSVALLKPVDFDQDGNYWFNYNYFEEDLWEDAGYSAKDSNFYSNKVGWGPFNWTIKAAYILRELYMDDFSIIRENNDIIFKEKPYFLGWINYLFNERYVNKNWDQWEVYLRIKDTEDFKRCGFDSNCSDYAGKVPVISYYEVKAVDNGFKRMLSELENDDNITIHDFKVGVNQIREIIKDFKESSSLTTTGQIDLLLAGIDHLDQDYDTFLAVNRENDDFVDFMQFNKELIQSRVLAVKAVSEVYEIDFWQLYDCLEVKERIIDDTNLSLVEMPAYSIRTDLLFNLTPDDLLYYFQEGDEMKFSRELKKWFMEWQKTYQDKINEELVIKNPTKWICDILTFIHANYYGVFAFSSFFYETMENINDQRYLLLWKILEDMAYDEEMLEIGSVLFKETESKQKKLKEYWGFIKRYEKNNKARLKLKRYLSLLANKRLRKEMFGI